MAPGGVILETMVAEAVYSDFNLTYTPWDICSPLPAPLRSPSQSQMTPKM